MRSQQMKYRLLALDVDGTLLDGDQRIPTETIEAIAEADAAGLRICIATGRSYVETIPVWRQLRLAAPYEPMVLIGGALVAEPDTGRTLYQRTIPRDLAREYADALIQSGYSAMAIVDAWRHGVDYYLAEGPDAEQVQRMWFAKMNVKIRRVRRLMEDGEPPALRIHAVAPPDAAGELSAELGRRFAGRLNVHSIYAPNYGVTVVEAFAETTSKWNAILYVAQAMRIGPGQIAAVGDDVNDLPMIRAAGLGAAMPCAPPAVKAAAKRIAEPSLAHFIRQIIAES
jgi:Cof subfamily protein (haloacid dehalogenase superfamily)